MTHENEYDDKEERDKDKEKEEGDEGYTKDKLANLTRCIDNLDAAVDIGYGDNYETDDGDGEGEGEDECECEEEKDEVYYG